MPDGPQPWPRAQRIPLVVAGQQYPFGYQAEWWQAVEEYHRSTCTAVVAPFAMNAAGINEAITWWNRRADALARGNTDAYEQIEAPQRDVAEQAAERARACLAEDDAVARDVENSGEWHASRHDRIPLVQVNVVTADEKGCVDEFVAADVWRSDGVHIARHDPARVLDQCGALGDVLTELERIAERSPDPDSRMWARGAIVSLARVWEPDEDEAPLHDPAAGGHVEEGRSDS